MWNHVASYWKRGEALPLLWRTLVSSSSALDYPSLSADITLDGDTYDPLKPSSSGSYNAWLLAPILISLSYTVSWTYIRPYA